MRRTYALLFVALTTVGGCDDQPEAEVPVAEPPAVGTTSDPAGPDTTVDLSTTTLDVVDVLQSDAAFGVFVAALDSAGMLGLLEAEGPYTVFAPTNDAFRAAGGDGLLAPESRTRLREVLSYHLVQGRVIRSADVDGAERFPTVETSDVLVSRQGDGLSVNEAQVLQADVGAANGIVHVVDRVLFPPEDVSPPDVNR